MKKRKFIFFPNKASLIAFFGVECAMLFILAPAFLRESERVAASSVFVVVSVAWYIIVVAIEAQHEYLKNQKMRRKK